MASSTCDCKWIPVLILSLFLLGGINQTTKDALKVRHILKTIEKQAPNDSVNDHRAEVTEQELNSYISYRIHQEKASIIKSITITLMEHNHLMGMIHFDAKALNLAALLGDVLDFNFKGVLYSTGGKAKIEFISLQLGGHPVKPQVLDFVLDAAAIAYGVDGRDPKGWYDLPKGMKTIAIDKRQLTLTY